MNKILLTCLLLLCCSPAYADIYKYMDPDGKFYITDHQLNAPYRLISKPKEYRPHNPRTIKPFNSAAYKKNIKKYMPHIKFASIKYNIDHNLIHAIVDTESSFNPKAYSKAGAVGLMQLMPKTAKSLGVKNSWNPSQNILGGTFYFRQLLDKFNQNIRLSLAAYNAGAGAVKRAGNIVPNYPETQRYVRKVIQRYDELKQAS
ncbi:MAG: lytic transglycosylase domain-containing protein [Ghiorsea sp.]